MEKPAKKHVILILNNIRSSENVGSIFRTADAAGVSKIILCGYTPAPIDRFGRENIKLTKAALGAEKSMAWERYESLEEAVQKLKNSPSGSQPLRKPPPAMMASRARLRGNPSAFKIVGVEQDQKAINYKKIKDYYLKSDTRNLAIVFGNEVDGLSKEDLRFCDVVVEIPMRGAMVRQARHPHRTKAGKESLNVSVAAGIVLFEILK